MVSHLINSTTKDGTQTSFSNSSLLKKLSPLLVAWISLFGSLLPTEFSTPNPNLLVDSSMIEEFLISRKLLKKYSKNGNDFGNFTMLDWVGFPTYVEKIPECDERRLCVREARGGGEAIRR
ncbi:hypothetical protein M6B38_357820 [Iris pallida]|uniref:Uncharacterized protein n=1 Tax=Iris pallida TaxID=29817 RepID=A0AAX6GMF5_IRIPA|nr:hypothetical protein M6B38_357820 [Iris pallida]